MVGTTIPIWKEKKACKDYETLRKVKQRYNLWKSAFFNHISTKNVAHLKKVLPMQTIPNFFMFLLRTFLFFHSEYFDTFTPNFFFANHLLRANFSTKEINNTHSDNKLKS